MQARNKQVKLGPVGKYFIFINKSVYCIYLITLSFPFLSFPFLSFPFLSQHTWSMYINSIEMLMGSIYHLSHTRTHTSPSLLHHFISSYFILFHLISSYFIYFFSIILFNFNFNYFLKGVITPYSDQVIEIKRRLHNAGLTGHVPVQGGPGDIAVSLDIEVSNRS